MSADIEVHRTHHMAYSGKMPCTELLKCTMCGLSVFDEGLAQECKRTSAIFKPGIPESELPPYAESR